MKTTSLRAPCGGKPGPSGYWPCAGQWQSTSHVRDSNPSHNCLPTIKDVRPLDLPSPCYRFPVLFIWQQMFGIQVCPVKYKAKILN